MLPAMRRAEDLVLLLDRPTGWLASIAEFVKSAASGACGQLARTRQRRLPDTTRRRRLALGLAAHDDRYCRFPTNRVVQLYGHVSAGMRMVSR